MAKEKAFDYPGERATVSWQGKLCIHIGECGRAKGDSPQPNKAGAIGFQGQDQAFSGHHSERCNGICIRIDPPELGNHGPLGAHSRDVAAEAAEQFRFALERDPGFKRAAFGLARSLQEGGRTDPAIAAWKAYLVLDDTSSWAAAARRNLKTLQEPGDS